MSVCVCVCVHILQTGLFDVHPTSGKITVQGPLDIDQGSDMVAFVITATDQVGLSSDVRHPLSVI